MGSLLCTPNHLPSRAEKGGDLGLCVQCKSIYCAHPGIWGPGSATPSPRRQILGDPMGAKRVCFWQHIWEGNILLFSKEEANQNGWAAEPCSSYSDTKPMPLKTDNPLIPTVTCPGWRLRAEQEMDLTWLRSALRGGWYCCWAGSCIRAQDHAKETSRGQGKGHALC